ncbi:hypothetical protein BGW36DRAFT_418639 [Talaromyces proteolyticus]|uniref:Replication factor C subunit 2 n=1 Tax=Talaromyces proteolyticus TaxID=1131652 RepID=A0AAD4KN15_9EURO|nr:uncharacterized protein BGW36DRAFT_418639 [Talaromyces proteolyticus]KAH8694055.1 hypothetical protein BGW36DRAFT_418639 [Talaromyces proteolyticus]
MSSIHILQNRLKDVSDSLNAIKPLINRLRNFTHAVGQGDEARVELGAEVHSRLKVVEEETELLNVEVESLEGTGNSRRKTGENAEKEAEKRRVIGFAEKLTADLKRTRGEFRAAQLQANRNAEAARRKERELLFTRSADDQGRQLPSEKFTQNDLVANASSDVTAALRRTHDLMQAELSRSQFAQETLDQSTAALSSLSESYTNLDTVLSSSRALVNSLLRSQKSDTWYLETAFYILVATIAWLLFRRILYGPMWWLAWMPVRTLYRFFASVLGVAGFSGAVTTTSAIGENAPVLETPDSRTGKESEEDNIMKKIGKMAGKETTSDNERYEDYDGPRNPKKRMWEEDVTRKDELAAAAATSSKQKPTDNKEDQTRLQPWVEKYRPKSLDDVAAQDHTTTVLQRTLQASNLPHMLFYGPPGTGKTSTILALAKSLFGPVLYRTRILELNASDERGINIVREKIKDFARTQLSQPTGLDAAYREQYPCPPFKIIILDEADCMTHDAQSALRRTMEQYSRITRFCLVCNYVTRIIEPLASRCSKFRFKALDGVAAGDRLEDIAKAENLVLEKGAVETLIRCSEGDLRRAITYMQSAARLVGAQQKKQQEGGDGDVEMGDADSSSIITIRTIEEIAGVVPESVLDRLTQAMQPKKLGSAYEAVATVVSDIVADGWSATQILSQLYQRVVFNDAIPDIQKNKIVGVFSEMDRRLIDGSDEHLSILDMVMRISGILGS